MDSCEVVEEKKRDCVHKNFCGPTSGGTGKRSIASKRCVKVGACGQGKRELPCVNCEQNKGKRELAAEDEEMVVIETQKKCSREVGERELCTREVTKREVTKRGCDRNPGPGRPPCIPKKKGKRIEDEEHEIIETRFECRRGMDSCEVVEEKKRDCVHKNFCGPTSGGSGKRSIASKRCVACPQNKGRKWKVLFRWSAGRLSCLVMSCHVIVELTFPRPDGPSKRT